MCKKCYHHPLFELQLLFWGGGGFWGMFAFSALERMFMTFWLFWGGGGCWAFRKFPIRFCASMASGEFWVHPLFWLLPQPLLEGWLFPHSLLFWLPQPVLFPVFPQPVLFPLFAFPQLLLLPCLPQPVLLFPHWLPLSFPQPLVFLFPWSHPLGFPFAWLLQPLLGLGFWASHPAEFPHPVLFPVSPQPVFWLVLPQVVLFFLPLLYQPE